MIAAGTSPTTGEVDGGTVANGGGLSANDGRPLVGRRRRPSRSSSAGLAPTGRAKRRRRRRGARRGRGGASVGSRVPRWSSAESATKRDDRRARPVPGQRSRSAMGGRRDEPSGARPAAGPSNEVRRRMASTVARVRERSTVWTIAAGRRRRSPAAAPPRARREHLGQASVLADDLRARADPTVDREEDRVGLLAERIAGEQAVGGDRAPSRSPAIIRRSATSARASS